MRAKKSMTEAMVIMGKIIEYKIAMTNELVTSAGRLYGISSK